MTDCKFRNWYPHVQDSKELTVHGHFSPINKKRTAFCWSRYECESCDPETKQNCDKYHQSIVVE